MITEERFARNVKGVIENHRTDYSHDFEILDTKKFRQEYYERFDIDKTIQLIAKRKICLYLDISQLLLFRK